MIAKEGEIIQWIRILVALDEDWSSDPSTILGSSQPPVPIITHSHLSSEGTCIHVRVHLCAHVHHLCRLYSHQKFLFSNCLTRKWFLPILIKWHGVKSFFVCLFLLFLFFKIQQTWAKITECRVIPDQEQTGTSYEFFWEL